ncbi:MAG: flagellar basal body-associated FliL family protein [bacterium]
MADSKTLEVSRPPSEEPRDAPEPSEASSAPTKSNFTKWAVLAGVLVLQVIASYFLQRALLFSPPKPAQAHTVEVKQTTEKKRKGHAAEASKASEIVLLDEIIVNPAETGGRRFLAATIGFEVTGEEPNVVEQRKPLIRDRLIGLLSSKTITQLADITYRDTLRAEIRTKIEEELHPLSVPRVFFTGYVLQ